MGAGVDRRRSARVVEDLAGCRLKARWIHRGFESEDYELSPVDEERVGLVVRRTWCRCRRGDGIVSGVAVVMRSGDGRSRGGVIVYRM